MDSGNEVIIVDDSVVTTNGINGNHEETGEMKTRSKSGGDEEVVKSKLRNTRAGAEKIAVDEKKKNLRSSDADDTKSGVKDATRKGKTVEDEKVTVASAVAAIASGTTLVTTMTTKKKSGDREDDSGINSRASSVSNDEVIGPRMRTRSKTQELASTSTPANKRGQIRAPLASHDFEDNTFEDELPSHSLKRKVHVFIEEMDEIEEELENGEPVAKRLSIGGSVVNVLWSPLRAIGGKVSAVLPRRKLQPSKVEEINIENGEDETEVEKQIEENDVEVSAVGVVGNDRTDAKNLSRTCTIM